MGRAEGERGKGESPVPVRFLLVGGGGVLEVGLGGASSKSSSEGIYWKLRREFTVLPLDGTALAFVLLVLGMGRRQK